MGRAALIVVDVQERLFAAMEADRRDEMVANVKILVAAAQRLGVPTLVTEQYPKGLGRTLPEVAALLKDAEVFEKTSFSCCGVAGFEQRVRALNADEIVLAGIETHVCVLLTALDLARLGFRTAVAADATCSRRRESRDLGLAQARQEGVVVTSTETAVFSWLGRADTAAFREIATLLK
jgi:nicotinamidase-related amidase